MPVPARPIMRRLRVWGVVLTLSAFLAVGMIALENRASRSVHAQAIVPPILQAIVFNGNVTINGEQPAYSGFTITARISDKWESPPVVVGSLPDRPSQYAHLLVAPEKELDLVGSQIEFWLDGQVLSTTANWYAVINPFSNHLDVPDSPSSGSGFPEPPRSNTDRHSNVHAFSRNTQTRVLHRQGENAKRPIARGIRNLRCRRLRFPVSKHPSIRWGLLPHYRCCRQEISRRTSGVLSH